MATTLKKHNPSLKTNNDTGFGSNANDYGGRFINKDGSFNLRREGMPYLRNISIYQKLLNLPVWKFIGSIILFYIVANLLFTTIYLFIGVDQLQGINTTDWWTKFKQVFYFSTETFTTVGY